MGLDVAAGRARSIAGGVMAIDVEPSFHRLRDGAEVTLRVGEEADARQLLLLVIAVNEDGMGQVAVAEEAPDDLHAERARIASFREHPNDLLIAAFAGDRVVGMVDFKAGRRQRQVHRGTLGISTLPGWRGRGLGSLLLGTLVAWAEARPTLEKLALNVLADNPQAIALYRKFGFVEEGRRPREIKRGDGDYVDDILMYRFV
jgi:RimJ/RimL family protein N-acetyltransferase